MEEKRTVQQLTEMQSWPLEKKIQTSIARIIEFYEAYSGNVYVSYSGGKDSTVLLHLVRSVYPDVPALFSNTGLEYMEIQHHVRQTENCEIVRPKMKFTEVIMEYGYPVISKEVSEAIYYARRRPAEREKKERERACDAQCSWVPIRETDLYQEIWTIRGHRTILKKRKELMGLRMDEKEAEPG